MKKFLKFIDDFIKADFETEYESNFFDQTKYAVKFNKLKTFFSKEISPGHQYVLTSLDLLDDDEKKIFQEQAKSIIPRTFFKIKKWEHAKEGTLYQVYLSNTTNSAEKGYFQSLIAKEVKGKFYFTGRYSICYACYATGVHNDKSCPDCSGRGWEYREGLKLKKLGDKKQEVFKYQAPGRKEFMKEYESN